MNDITLAFMMTLVAGLCTGLGSVIAFFSKKDNKVFLSVSLGFSAGVMIYVSMIEIFQKAQQSLISDLGEKTGAIITVVSFFGGMLLIGLIDKLIPKGKNPHEFNKVEESITPIEDKSKLMRMGLFTALALAIHNFPEGLATFVSVLQDPVLAIPIVVAIALHNIPEGIAVSVPIYHATGSKKKAFFYSFISGLTEPLGALIGWLILMPIMSDTVFGIIFAMVAGIMVFISLDELLPCAKEYGKHHHAIYGLVLGMIVMAVSLLLFI
ncbi:MAG: zinc transporter ZupT [bacterium]